MALALLRTAATALRTLDALPLYEELIVTGAWWDYVDAVATGPLGALLPEVAPALRAWSVDADMWKRRAAIIAQVRRKGATDFALLTDCIEPNRGDREFFIRKAIGWALRAYAWVDPEAVIAYCDAARAEPAEPPRGAQERRRASRRRRSPHRRSRHRRRVAAAAAVAAASAVGRDVAGRPPPARRGAARRRPAASLRRPRLDDSRRDAGPITRAATTTTIRGR